MLHTIEAHTWARWVTPANRPKWSQGSVRSRSIDQLDRSGCSLGLALYGDQGFDCPSVLPQTRKPFGE
jgi:hypothetical protein